MTKAAGHILKSEDVNLEGRLRLDVGQLQSPTVRTKEKSPPLTAPQVRIVESHHDFADIEITCSCGIKTHLKCEYAGVLPSDGPKPQNGQAGVPDQKPEENKINGEKQNAD